MAIYSKRPSGGQAVAERPTGPLATEKQVYWIMKLAAEQGTPREQSAVEAMGRKEASTLLDILFEVGRTIKASKGVDDGFYRLNGQYVKVVWNQAGTRKYAMVYDGAHWDYEGAKGMYAQLTPAMVLTAEDAAEFGHLYGKCVYCHLRLTDDRSIAVGYGRDCAGQRGLPWG